MDGDRDIPIALFQRINTAISGRKIGLPASAAGSWNSSTAVMQLPAFMVSYGHTATHLDTKTLQGP
jgi:hypothetical protein